MCVVFFLPRPLVPTEQLVLTAIRQEASELQDPGQGAGATMRARLTDRFDKSEFARIGLDDAQLVSRVQRCMWPCHSQRLRAAVLQPPALKSYNV